MRKFSIRYLMLFILAIAVAFAALRGANAWWAGGFVLATLGLLGFSIMGLIHGQGRNRAAWLGFLILGGGYFVAFRALPVHELGSLPTVQLLQFVQDQVIPPNAITVNFTSTGTITTTTPGTPVVGTAGLVIGSTATPPGSTNVFLVSGPSGPTITTWKSVLPGAANADAFRSVGQSLFTLLFGWIGAVISKRMWSRRGLREAMPSADSD